MRQSNTAPVTADKIVYAAVPPSTATDVQAELDYRARHVGTAAVITSFADLQALFPADGGLLHTVNTMAQVTAFDGLPPGHHITVEFPGGLNTGGSLGVLIAGDFAGPLIDGEINLIGVAVLNTNAGGSDIVASSPSGRPMRMDGCQLLGLGGVEVQSGGTIIIDQCLFAPVAPGASGLSVTGTIADMLLTNTRFDAPGTVPYVGMTVAASATIGGEITGSRVAVNSVLAGDALYSISPSATLPGGGVRPATVSGIRLAETAVRGPGSMFAAGSLHEQDIQIVAVVGTNAPDTRLLGNAFVDVSGGTLITLDFALVTIGTDVVVPPTNGVGGDLALQALSSHFTLDISDPLNPFLRFDGPDSNKNGRVTWYFDFIKNGAANSIDGVVAIDSGSGYVVDEQSRSAARLAPTAIAQRVESMTPVLMDSGDKLQLRARSDGNSAIDISRIVFTTEAIG